jgi:hypothetical protein
MSIEDKKRKILEDYMKSASPEERRELNRLLKSREKKPADDFKTRGMNMDVNQLAKNMSRQINEQLGMADINIKKMAKDLVVQMALQHKPDITPKELNAIVNQMVPEKRESDIIKKVPADLLRNMVAQFIAYSTNSMPVKDQAQLPDGWAKKYWGIFSQDMRDLITMYLKNGIDNRNFWTGIEKLIKKSHGGR